MNLQNISELGNDLRNYFLKNTDWSEVTFNSVDKEKLKELPHVDMVYSHSIKFKTESKIIFIPSQYILLAVKVKEFALELIKYADAFDRIKSLNGKNSIGEFVIKGIELGNSSDFSEVDLELFRKMYSTTSEELNFGAKSIINGDVNKYKLRSSSDFFGSVILKIINVPDVSSAKLGSLIYSLSKETKLYNYLEDRFSATQQNVSSEKNQNICEQNIIYYGSPGTGKSHRADDETKGENVQKVTFHPDYDYHSFVGGYKPTMVGDKIAYKFVPQIFTRIYVDAWKNLVSDDETKPFYLQIEEINRGNCAEIFGDLFQLLDRKADGSSKYEVTAEEELYKYLLSADGFGGDHDGIREGKLRFPSNLKIIATMNTSDQSLFPMDSAFKRRWDWEYVPIDYNCPSSNFNIQLDNGKKFKWLDFLKSVNKEIFNIDKNQDKQIGNWFINAENSNNIISEKIFINKVIFYLWNDVFKDEERTIFKLEGIDDITYTNFFEEGISENLVSNIFEKRLGLMEEPTDEE